MIKLKKICILVPIIKSDFLTGKEQILSSYKDTIGDSFELSCLIINEGPESIESRWEEAWAVPSLVEIAKKAELEGAHGLIVDCMGDPGVEELREIVSIPVIGPCQSSMHLAANIGRGFGFLAGDETTAGQFGDQVRKAGLESHYVGSIPINMPVLDITKDTTETLSLLCRSSEILVKEKKADTIILGCTGYRGLANPIREYLRKNDINVSVIDPMSASLRLLSLMIEEQIMHSKTLYPFPKNHKKN